MKQISAGGATDTLHGPGADSTWAVTGAGAGSVGGLAFSGFENLAGAADNKDNFVLAPGGSVSGVIDGGAGGFDTLQVMGGALVSNPTDAHSGAVIVDATTITYAGLEPVALLGATVTINGADLGGSTELLDKDYLKVSPYSDGSSATVACQTAGNCIQVENFLGPFGTGPAIAELSYFVIAGTSSVTINGGLGTDTVEFTGDYLVPGSSLTVNAEHIKVGSGLTVDVGSASGNDITFNAVYKDNGISLLGITTTIPVLGVDGLVDIDSATFNGNSISLTAFAGTLSTTVNGGGQALSGGNLIVASVAGFDNSSGTFGVVGGTGTCAYTGRDTTLNKLTGITGCTGTPADGAVVTSAITENGSGTGVNHAAMELEYYATVNVHGNSSLTAGGNVTLASSVDVTATANAVPVKGTWVSGTAYSKNDVVIDPSDGKRYSAKNDIASSTTAPSSASADWDDASGHDSAVAASTLVANSTSNLSGTSTISATSGNVTISSNLKSSITTQADATQSGSGAGIAVGVVVTHSEAFIDSTAADARARAEPHRLGRHRQQGSDDRHGEPGRIEGQRHFRQ